MRCPGESPKTYIADVLVRRPSPTIPAAASTSIALEPVLSDEVFEHILGVIRGAAEAMERSPKTSWGALIRPSCKSTGFDPRRSLCTARADESASTRLRAKELANALSHLNPRMRCVLALRFGLDGETPQTLEEVGVGLGITRERVRQLESRAVRELRTAALDLELYLRAE